MSLAPYFARDYSEARSKFLVAAGNAGARIDHFQNPLRGPQGEKLFADAAWIGPPDATRVIVTISATHGGEGYCGSGCQVAWYAQGFAAKLPKGVAALAIHAINPNGFAWTRRVTEDNVDLNRNFLNHATPHPANPGYVALADAITPLEWTDASRAASLRAFDVYKAEHGDEALRRALMGGQYSHPGGIFFGGHAPTWSNRTLRAIFARYLAKVPHVAVIDYHTGLGPYGHGELICALPKNSPHLARMQSWLWGEMTSTEAGTSSSVKLLGINQQGMYEMLPNAALSPLALEFGTLSIPEVLDALRADNWLHVHGDLASPQAKEIKAQMRAAFYPDKDDWREMVWARALKVNEAMIAGLAAS
ncbi:MAG: DUF2817 domain-containing protein [Rhodospirillales bacterium]|nr:DUF2817 domain-containing protein [Rhodospirillales bacterium]